MYIYGIDDIKEIADLKSEVIVRLTVNKALKRSNRELSFKSSHKLHG